MSRVARSAAPRLIEGVGTAEVAPEPTDPSAGLDEGVYDDAARDHWAVSGGKHPLK